jgi:hypothetical protein
VTIVADLPRRLLDLDQHRAHVGSATRGIEFDGPAQSAEAHRRASAVVVHTHERHHVAGALRTLRFSQSPSGIPETPPASSANRFGERSRNTFRSRVFQAQDLWPPVLALKLHKHAAGHPLTETAKTLLLEEFSMASDDD